MAKELLSGGDTIVYYSTLYASDLPMCKLDAKKLNRTSINQLGTYVPVLLAIMALNALTVVVLVLGALVYVYRRRSRARARKTPGRTMTPMPMTAPPMGAVAPIADEQHGTYQPVSMALTEDTLLPPSPAFQEGKMRPMSVA